MPPPDASELASQTGMARTHGGKLAAAAGMLPPDAGELVAAADVAGASGMAAPDDRELEGGVGGTSGVAMLPAYCRGTDERR